MRPVGIRHMGPSGAWVAHLRLQVPPVPASVAQVNIAHRVHNVYEQLSSGLLPPDLWNEETELAAMVHLIMQYPLEIAATCLRNAVANYNHVNAHLRLPLIDFSADRAERKLASLTRYIKAMPKPLHAASVYCALLDQMYAARAA